MAKQTAHLVKREYLIPFILVTSLFFLWGFARSILDVLNKHFQDSMHISISHSTMIQATTYVGYFLMAIPAGLIITRWGYRRGVVMGLLLFAIGSLLFIPSEQIGSFNFFLVSLFIVGCGLVMLETSANPYITELGDKATGASRLNLAQSFNGLGCILAPAIMAPLLFSDHGSASIALPYSIMGIVVFAIAILFCFIKLPEISSANAPAEQANQSTRASLPANRSALSTIKLLIRNRDFMLGVTALFFYEIAEISINSFFINYVTADDWMSKSTAAVVLSFGGLGLFMLARILGSFIMNKIRAERVLLVCAIGAVIGALLVTLNLGMLSKAGLFACYAFEAIMFPTIFALSVRGLGQATKIASSFLMMSPLGGAVGALSMGYVADAVSVSASFIVPTIGYAVVLIYTLSILLKKQSAA
jgi:FHS family L-fucose permease-like MFS transporter